MFATILQITEAITQLIAQLIAIIRDLSPPSSWASLAGAAAEKNLSLCISVHKPKQHDLEIWEKNKGCFRSRWLAAAAWSELMNSFVVVGFCCCKKYWSRLSEFLIHCSNAWRKIQQENHNHILIQLISMMLYANLIPIDQLFLFCKCHVLTRPSFPKMNLPRNASVSSLESDNSRSARNISQNPSKSYSSIDHSEVFDLLSQPLASADENGWSQNGAILLSSEF